MILNKFRKEKALNSLCTFGIGGLASFFIEVRDYCEMAAALQACQQNALPFRILGKGSNCLFSDQGFHGAIILNKIEFIQHIQPGRFHVGGGTSFSLLGTQTARQGWSGLEFAAGIPATVGGAVYMNAGANGSETSEFLVSVDFINADGNLQTFKKDQLEFSYRFSTFQKSYGAIVGATFQLTPDFNAREKQLTIISYRKSTQPYGQKSAGCIFRNPSCGHAGALIEACGLKGKTIGGAQVSTLHANFIVNTGHATTQNVLELISFIQSEVFKQKGIALESEVQIINPFS